MTHINPSTLNDMLRDSLKQGQHPRLTVTSNSMAPLFKAGDQVILEAIQPEQLQANDIVTISDPSPSGQSLLTHRIWAIRDNVILTRGDHALVFDKLYSPEVILGRVVGRTRQQRTLSFKTGLGQWLDHYLTALAHQEYRWLTGSQEVPFTEFEPLTFNTRTKLVHRLFYGWAIFISSAVNLATRIKSGENKI